MPHAEAEEDKLNTFLVTVSPVARSSLICASLPPRFDPHQRIAGVRLHAWEMATFFRSSALARGEATQALPLLRATWPDIDLARWQEFVEAFADRSGAARSGVLALRDAADCLCGLVAYRVERNLRHGAVLSAHLFTAIDLANSLAVLHALLDAVESKSVELGCEAHEIRLWKEQAAVVTRLRTLGLSQGAGLYAKPVHHRRQAC